MGVGAGVHCVLGGGWSRPEPEWEGGQGAETEAERQRDTQRQREAGRLRDSSRYRCSGGGSGVGTGGGRSLAAPQSRATFVSLVTLITGTSQKGALC